VSSWRVKWAQSVEAMGLVSVRGAILWKKVPASRWAWTRHMIVGGEEPRHMMDYVGQWLHVVDTV
jgi:hypothetical protein